MLAIAPPGLVGLEGLLGGLLECRDGGLALLGERICAGGDQGPVMSGGLTSLCEPDIGGIDPGRGLVAGPRPSRAVSRIGVPAREILR